jgi:enediyne polyketide synthase
MKAERNAIAVVGIGCRYPGARDTRQLWENILARRRQFRRFPDVRLPLSDYFDPDPAAPDKTYGARGAFIDGFQFDWKSRFVPKLAYETADIAHWLALETALSALADAGLSRETVSTERSGVILGNTLTGEHTRATSMRQRWPFVRKSLRAAARARGLSEPLLRDLETTMQDYYQSVFAPTTEDSLSGGLSNTIAGRICNYLDFHGGGYTVDGACASSLLAIATAANALVDREMDLALAGGVDVSLDTFELIGFAKTGALTKDEMRVYDRRANGFIPGEGCGFVVLKRLEDARVAGDRVYAVLRGWGVSSDGKGGLTAPSREGQARALRRAYARAGYDAASVDFFEGHGTGTSVGDRVEIEAIALAVGDGETRLRRQGVTSFKSLVGHTKAAAGVGGFIKAVLAVNRRVLPPTAGCEVPNPVFEERAPTLYPILLGEMRHRDDRLRAGVSAMGFGGINCHVTLESADPPDDTLSGSLDERALMAHEQHAEIFVFAADSREALAQKAEEARTLAAGVGVGEMADLAARLAAASQTGAWRAAIVAGAPDELLERLMQLEAALREGRDPASPAAEAIRIGHAREKARLAFVFPGQGSQQLLMARALVERHGWARDLYADAGRWLDEIGSEPLSATLFPPLDRARDEAQRQGWARDLARTEVAQPAICFASLLWLSKLERLGLRAGVVAGHSLGELTAFRAAGAFDDETLIKLAALRGRAMSAPLGEAGAMASLVCDADRAREILAQVKSYATIANRNGPRQTVVSGAAVAIDAVMGLARDAGIGAQRLAVSNAFHSSFVAGAETRLRENCVAPLQPLALHSRLLSGIDGQPVGPEIELREHFARQITAPVDFIAVAQRLSEEADLIFEVGPGQVLTGLLRENLRTEVCAPIASRAGDWSDLLKALARAFCAGHDVEWSELYRDRLIREFVPTSEKTFIDNPCERPFRPTQEWKPLPDAGVSGALAAQLGLGAVDLENYMMRRGKFIAEVIRADIDARESEISVAEVEALATPSPARETPKRPDHATLAAQLIALTARATGFPEESISPDMRLLDHLNLDSIKAGELVAAAAKAAGIAGALDATAFANASLAEIAAAIEKSVREKAGAAAPLPLPLPRDRDAVARPEWIRCFKVDHAASPLAAAVADWRNAKALVLHEAGDEALAEALRSALLDVGADAVLRRTFDDARQEQTALPADLTLRVAFLPRALEEKFDLSECVRRLQLLAVIPRGASALAIVQFGGGWFGAGSERAALDRVGAGAFAASLHHERPELKLRVIDADAALAPASLAGIVLSELLSAEPFARAGYDAQAVRRAPQIRPEEPALWPTRGLSWTGKDVILATGGARGVTAECALAFAKATGVRMALVGSSPPTAETSATLERFASAALTARYYQCDICDARAVSALMAKARAELGAITGLIHGAALNKPRRAEQVDTEAALAEIQPKAQGVLNLLAALAEAPPKLVVGLSSIIGVTGMPGNAWYAYSNELLDLILRDFGRTHPQTQAVSIAFGLWSEVGMGARTGGTERLARMGIGAIPPREGVERFLQLVNRDPGASEIVVTAPVGGLDTWSRTAPPKPLAARYLEEVRHFEPGVDLRVRARLSFARDPYVCDHIYKGSALFPTVFGLEAMAQAAAWMTGRERLDGFVIENIALDRPIVVDPDSGAEIELHALAHERDAADAPQRIDVTISTAQSGFQATHFAATFILEGASSPQAAPIAPVGEALAIEPKSDLYGWLLFQGERFQRLRRIHRLDSRLCVASAEARDYFGQDGDESYLLGDPYFRDSLLQSAQLTVPKHLSLPIRIGRIVSRNAAAPGNCERHVEARFDGFATDDDRQLLAHVTVFDGTGLAIEEIADYRLAVVERRAENPSPEEIAAPDDYDSLSLARAVEAAAAKFGLIAPSLAVAYGRWHALERDARRQAELPHIRRLLSAAGAPETEVAWRGDHRPFARRAHGLGLSVSHDDGVCVIAVGKEPQACDVAPVIRSEGAPDWRALLGDARAALLSALVAEGDSPDAAGARLWTVIECLRKAHDTPQANFAIVRRSGDAALFESEAESGKPLRILTIPWRGLRGPQRLVAVALCEPDASSELVDATEGFDLAVHGGALGRGPQGQIAFKLRFPLSFRETSYASRRLYFTHYFAWMGKLREAACQPAYGALVDDLSSGRWGMVTNHAETEILDAVAAHDVIEGRIWLAGLSGAQRSKMDLHYEWTAERPDGRRVLVARSRMTTSWVEILDHGVVRAQPLPDYLQKLMVRFSPQASGGDDWGGCARRDLGALLHAYPDGPADRLLLRESRHETALEDSNLVGNIYFSNYYVWQGRSVDRYLASLIPEAFRKAGKNGEFFCSYSRIEHLREAMPFDTIVVRMFLGSVHRRGLRLRFEFFREEAGGELQKLAWGDHDALWTRPDAEGCWRAADLPEHLVRALAAAPALRA